MNKGRVIIFSIGGGCLVILIGVFIYMFSGSSSKEDSKPPVLNQEDAFGYSDMMNQLDDERYNSKNESDSSGEVKKLDLEKVYFGDDTAPEPQYNDDNWDEPEPIIVRNDPDPEPEPQPVIQMPEPEPEPVIEPIDPREALRQKKLRLESGKSSIEDSKNISVAINGTQTIKNGQTVSLRLLADSFVAGLELKKNSIIYGVAKFENYRVAVNVTSVRVGNQIAATNFMVYGMDGQPGIPITANQVLTDTKQRTTKEAEQEIDDLNIPGSSILTDIFTKDRNAKVKLINNHKLILIATQR